MLAHCFNHQRARGRMQYSDWPVWQSIRIKCILNIAFIQFPTSKFHFIKFVFHWLSGFFLISGFFYKSTFASKCYWKKRNGNEGKKAVGSFRAKFSDRLRFCWFLFNIPLSEYWTNNSHAPFFSLKVASVILWHFQRPMSQNWVKIFCCTLLHIVNDTQSARICRQKYSTIYNISFLTSPF